jgi:Clp amino terminal domain, pathogenicity island component
VFERFTDRARRVVVLAQEEARLLNHDYIGTEHILLGLIHEGEGVAARALESLDLSLEAVRAQVEEVVGHGSTAPSGHIPFTPRAKKVLELGLREALQLGHNYIGTEHILLGLIREGEGVAAQTLVRLGADLDRVRRAVVALIGSDVSLAASGLESSVAPSGGIRPARCGFCDVPSPQCGSLFTGSSGALICQRCARTAAGEELHRAVATGMETSDVSSVLVETADSIEDLAARHEPTGPPPDDENAARQAIADAFGHAMEVGADGRTLINVEDGAALADCAELVRQRVGAIADQIEQVIEHIKFLDATTAVVWQTTLQNGRPPAPWLVRRECRAVFVDGRWKVSRDTICDLWKPLGIQCPPRADAG